MKSFQNLVLFKLGWVACILFAAKGYPVLSIASVAVVAGIHLARVAVPAKEALFLVCAGALGLVWESIVVNTGLLQYVGVDGNAWIAPAWIIAMWVLFGTTINHGLSWLKRHWVLPFTFGLLGGPMAFFAGSRMGAVEFTDTFMALAVLGAGWAVLLPLACLISDTITDSELLEPGTRRRSSPAGVQPVHITHQAAIHHG